MSEPVRIPKLISDLATSRLAIRLKYYQPDFVADLNIYPQTMWEIMENYKIKTWQFLELLELKNLN